MRIKTGDNVIIRTGKDKGKTGKVSVAFPAKSMVIIEGANMRKVRVKSREKGKQGETIEKSYPVHVSNVMLLDPKDKKPTRIGYVLKDGKKIRVAKKSNTTLS